VVVHASVQHGRQHQILRVLSHSRFGGQQRNRGGRTEVRDTRSDRSVHHESHAVRVRQIELSARARPEPPLAGAARPGVELDPGGGVQLGGVPLLHGGGHKEATGPDQRIPGHQRHRAAEEGGQLSERHSVPAGGPGVAVDWRGGAAQTEPKSAAVVAGRRTRMGQADRLQRVFEEFRRQPGGRRSVVAVDREQPEGRHRHTKRNNAKKVSVPFG